MRKALALLLALLVLAGTGLGLAVAAVLPARDRVELTETVRYGDRAAAEGAAVHARTTYNHHLFWDTACALGTELAADTDYTFSASEKRERAPIRYTGMELAVSGRYPFDREHPENDPTGLSAVYQELYDAAQPREEISKTVYLKDYLDYYLLDGFLNLPEYRLLWDTDFYADADAGARPEPGTEEYAVSALLDFFRIPVLEDEQLLLNLSKNLFGDTISWGYGSADSGDSYSMWSESVYTGDACYFTFDCHTQNGALVDTSLIPGGYGIYRLSRSAGETGVDVDGLATVYPLDPEAELLDLTLSPDQTKLLVHQRVEHTYVLTVVDLADMTTLQRLEVLDWTENSYGGWFLYEGDGFLVPVLDGSELAVLALNEDGRWEFRFSAQVTPPPAEGEEPLYYLTEQAVMDYDGRRLAVSAFLQNRDRWYDSCGFCLAVYDPAGLRYYGEYASSLSAGGDGSYSSLCRPLDYDPISVRLE